jgi:prepilin-type processing-associated H-X9-DG protein
MTDAEKLVLLAEHQSLIERAASKEREAAIHNAQANVLYTDAHTLRDRAAVVALELGIPE